MHLRFFQYFLNLIFWNISTAIKHLYYVNFPYLNRMLTVRVTLKPAAEQVDIMRRKNAN